MPTCVANHVHNLAAHSAVGVQSGMASNDMNYEIGQRGYDLRYSNNYLLSHPIGKNYTIDWENMERFWSKLIFQYMKCTPENHFSL